MKNIFYFKKICKIGGTEQFLYEIAKKYSNWDITVYYDEADQKQLERLKKFVRCKKHVPGEIIKCEKAFFNFNIDIINDVEAKEYYFVSHANYEVLGYKPPIENKKLTKLIGVSQFSTDKINDYAKKLKVNLKAEKCYNPLTLEPTDDVLILVSACRLDDVVKGGGRTLKLIEALDKYCEEHNRHYLWLIFTNPNVNINLTSPNVVLMQPRIDVRPYLAKADYVLQLSNDMETYCYTINEALGYGVPIVTTPLSVVKELPIDDNMRIELDYNCSNVDDVARQIFEKKVKPFKYNLPKDNWSKILAKGESCYKMDKIVKVKCVIPDGFYDYELGGKRKYGEIWSTYLERALHLENFKSPEDLQIYHLVDIIE